MGNKKQSKSKASNSKRYIASTAKPGKKKLWAYRLVSLILIPSLFLVILEFSLRLSGYGYRTEAVIKHKLEDKDVYCHNYQFGWRFFPRNIARNFDGFVFETEKPPDTYRIFVVGASAAMGMPAPAFNFGRILEVMLDDMYPEVDFEVHTAAMVAINSHAALEIVKDCARYEPDLLIIYLGNNEVVGPYGPGTVLSQGATGLPLIRASLAVKSTRTGQLLEQLLKSSVEANKSPQQWGGLEMFLDKQVRHDSPAMKSVYRHFETNLRDICRIGQKSGIPVIVSNVGCNLKDCPPFASLHRDNLTQTEKQSWNRSYQQGVAYETAGEYEQAITEYLAAGQMDNTFADLHFRLGRCYWETKKYALAKDEYRQARDYDTLRFRADEHINAIIRRITETQQKEGVYFVDCITALDKYSPHQTSGTELFYEHVHFNFSGNYVLASSIFSTVQNVVCAGLTPQSNTILSEEKAARYLAYTNFQRHQFLSQIYNKMLNKPPFTNQLYHDEFMMSTKIQIDELSAGLQYSAMKECIEQYKNARRHRPEDWHLLSIGFQDVEGREQELRELIQRCPYGPAYLTLGKILYKQGRTKEAQDIFYDLLEIMPNSGPAHAELALIYQNLGNNEKYIEHLSKGLSIDPTGSIDAYGALAWAYEKAGKPKKAIRTLYDAANCFPESETAPAHASLGYFLNTRGEYKKALEEMKLALKINPDYANDPLFQSLLQKLYAKANQ